MAKEETQKKAAKAAAGADAKGATKKKAPKEQAAAEAAPKGKKAAGAKSQEPKVSEPKAQAVPPRLRAAALELARRHGMTPSQLEAFERVGEGPMALKRDRHVTRKELGGDAAFLLDPYFDHR